VDAVPLDDLVTRLLSRTGFEYRLAMDDQDRDIAYRIRGETVLRQGWCEPQDLPEGRERDEYDERALHVLGWDGEVPMSTGRVVLPPHLPTEDSCGIVVEPAGKVVDVDRVGAAEAESVRQGRAGSHGAGRPLDDVDADVGVEGAQPGDRWHHAFRDRGQGDNGFYST
jgi:hypothetical protein